MKTAALTVTYNRLELLKENISALMTQTYPGMHIYIVDNASTDGTGEYVTALAKEDPRIKYFNTGANIGGAGGFEYGMREIFRGDYDACWLMDDDSVPEADALAELVSAAETAGDDWSFLASSVMWTDGKPCIMNKQTITEDKCRQADDMRAIDAYPIERTSFVGCFVNMRFARAAGLPIGRFFIYGDDTEYTLRLHALCPHAYVCGRSIIVHKMPYNARIGVAEAPFERISRYAHEYRNRVYIYRYRNNRPVIWIIGKYIKECAKIMLRSKDHRIKRMGVVIGGFFKGLAFHPVIEKV